MLEAAAEWGVTPWAIAGGSPARWFLRWQELARLKFEKQQRDEKLARMDHGRPGS